MAAVPRSSQRAVCRLLGVPRSALLVRPPRSHPLRRRTDLDARLVERIRLLIEQNPTHGYRLLTAWLRNEHGLRLHCRIVGRRSAGALPLPETREGIEVDYSRA